MSRKFFFLSIFTFLILLTSVYADCPALDSLLKTQDDLLVQAEKDRKDAWDQYASNCGAGGATDLKGKGNMCIYKDGWEMRYVHSGNTVPVPKCSRLTCYSGLGDIIGVLAWADIFNILGSLTSDQNLTGDCKEQCELWKANDVIINKDVPEAKAKLLETASVICSSPCNGRTGDDYKKCECERKDKKIWTWDESKNPKQCVACKDKEGSGNEYNKCMCINVQEGFWYEKENSCVGKACESKPVGLELDKCICEIEKKLVWHVKRKVCNYVPAAGSAPGLTPSGSEGEGDGLGGGAGYTAEGAAAGGASGGGSSGSDSSAAGAGGAEQGEANNGDKEKSVPWYKGLFGPMGFGSSGSVGSYSGAPQNNAGSKTKSTPVAVASINKVAPTDIMPKDSDNIFENLSKNYNRRYQARILSGTGI